MIIEIVNLVFPHFFGESGTCKKFIYKRFKSRKRKLQLLRAYLEFCKISKTSVVKVCNYMDVVDKYDDETFRRHFRMSRHCFLVLLGKLQRLLKPSTRRPRIEIKKVILLTLWALCNMDSYRAIADRFNVSQGTAHTTVIYICNLLVILSKELIKWPSAEEIGSLVENFNSLRSPKSFPGVVGCVDCMHIAIPAPQESTSSYYNRKGYHSLILQGICDSSFRFINVFFGWPGRSHDASVWVSSAVGQGLQSGSIKLPSNCHLLGDTAYPLRPYMMVPFKDDGHLDPKKVHFNKLLSSTRVLIEQSFGILTSKFRRLKFLNVSEPKYAKYYVLACIVIHNLIINEDKDHFIEELEFPADIPNEEVSESFDHVDSNSAGRLKRNFLAETLYNEQ